jgi:hypothetical protein
VCGLTFELTPTAEAGCARREVEHKQARFAAGTACRSGSGAEREVRPQCVALDVAWSQHGAPKSESLTQIV